MGKLAEICDTGFPIHFFTGNHDIWTFDYLEKEIGLQIYRNPIKIELQGKKCFIGHGDGLGPGDKGYKFLKFFFTNRFCQWFFSRLHPNISFSLASYLSVKSRISNNYYDRYKNENNECLVHYSKEMLTKEHFNYFIFGHRHLPLDIKLKANSRFINLGEWVNYNSYGVMEKGNFDLKFYKSKFSKAINK